MIFEKIKKQLKSKVVFLFISLLLLAIVLELLFFVCDPYLWSLGKQTVLTDNPNFNLVCADCSFNGGNYVVTGADPQIVYTGFSQKTNYIVIKLKKSPSSTLGVQVYYGTSDFGFSEENSIKDEISKFNNRIVLKAPGDEFVSFRLDLSANAEIESITLMDSEVASGLHIVDKFNIIRVFIMAAVFSLMAMLGYCWYKGRKKVNSLTVAELCFVIGVFIFYFLWNINQHIDYAPDELMRLDINFFLFENNRLPVGDELTHPIWGFSYAHMPIMLCNVLGYFFMLLVSPFASETIYLVIASRMVSVFAGTGAVYFIIKSAKILFDSLSKWVMIIIAAFIPQFAFLSSYVNNDILAVLGTSIIFYAWVYVINNKWNYKIATLLAIGLSVCATSYYNSYGWILISIAFCIITYFKQNPKDYKGFFKIAGYVSTLTVVLISYLFIRHLVLYGDLLGMSTIQKFGELYAQPGMKPSERMSLSEQGIAIKEMLFNEPYNWIKTTTKSFFALFGYMAYVAPQPVYKFYAIIFGAGILAFVALLVHKLIKGKKISFNTILLYTSLLAVSVITVFLSIYNSYTNDFQPQGRYCYPAFIPIVLVVSCGIDYLVKFLPNEKHRYFAIGAVCSSFIVVSLLVFKIVFIESCI